MVWVMDRGMTGESQRLALQRGGGHAIIGEKLRGGAKQAQEALKRPGRCRKVRDNLAVKEITFEQGSETRRFVLVRLVELETGRGWERIRDELDQIHRVDLRTKDGAFKVVTNLTPQQRKILKTLKTTPPKQVQAARFDAPAA